METARIDPKLIQHIIQSLYRLFRVGTFHSLDNQAIDISLAATLKALQQIDQFESQGMTLIFAEGTCIVNGQLLRAAPDVYESAMSFSAFLTRTGVNSITILKDVGESDLRSLLGLFVYHGDPSELVDAKGFVAPNIRLRMINPNLLLGLEDDRLSLLERVLLTYALSVLVLRRMFQSIEKQNYSLAGYFKRMARQLALVNYADRPIVFDVIVAHHLERDSAKLAINSAILAVAMTRRVTDHENALSRVCMAALLLDVGRHRPALVGIDAPAPAPLSTAIVQMAMGSLKGDSVERTVVTYEAQSILDGVSGDAIYSDHTPASFEAVIIATARRFAELVTLGGPGGNTDRLSIDDAVGVLYTQSRDEITRLCLDLLVDAIGLISRGAAVELDSGFRGVVVKAGPTPSKFEQPVVRLVLDAKGERCEPRDVDLSANDREALQHRSVVRVITRPDPVLRQAQAAAGGIFVGRMATRAASLDEIRSRLAKEAECRDPLDIAATDSGEVGQRERTTGGHAEVSARRRAIEWATESAQAVGASGSHRVLHRSAAAAEFEWRSSGNQRPAARELTTENPFAVRPATDARRRLPTDSFSRVDTGARRSVSEGFERGRDRPDPPPPRPQTPSSSTQPAPQTPASSPRVSPQPPAASPQSATPSRQPPTPSPEPRRDPPTRPVERSQVAAPRTDSFPEGAGILRRASTGSSKTVAGANAGADGAGARMLRRPSDPRPPSGSLGGVEHGGPDDPERKD